MMGTVNLVLSIVALALALSLAVLLATWCTVLSALREGLAEDDEELPLLPEPERDGDGDGDGDEEPDGCRGGPLDGQLAVTAPCGESGRV